MKPNGKNVVLRLCLSALCAVVALSTVAGAETVRGVFQLPVTARWGEIVLTPGEYEFTVDTSSASELVTIRSRTSPFSGMVMSVSRTELTSANGSRLALSNSEEGAYVHKLYLGEAKVALYFSAPKTSLSKVAKASPAVTMASASGGH